MLTTFVVNDEFDEMFEEQCQEVSNKFEVNFFKFNYVKELIVVYNAINNFYYMFI